MSLYCGSGVCASALLDVCASTLLDVCASPLLAVSLQCIAKMCMSFHSLVLRDFA